MKQFDCPECGEKQQIDDGDESAVCDDCGAILLISDENGQIEVESV